MHAEWARDGAVNDLCMLVVYRILLADHQGTTGRPSPKCVKFMHTALHIEATGWTEGQVRDVHSTGFHGCGTPHSFDVSISVNVTGPSAVRMLSGVG